MVLRKHQRHRTVKSNWIGQNNKDIDCPIVNIHDFFLTLASEPLLVILLALALRRLERRHLLLEILEGSHRVAIEPACKLRQTNNRVEHTSRIGEQTAERIIIKRSLLPYLVYSEGEPNSPKHQLLFVWTSLDGIQLRRNPSQVLHCQLHWLQFHLHIERIRLVVERKLFAGKHEGTFRLSAEISPKVSISEVETKRHWK
jgi:hypothetical protein